MRWMFTLLIALCCWTGSVASKSLFAGNANTIQGCSYRAPQSSDIPIAPQLSKNDVPPADGLRLGPRVKDFSIKNRLGTAKFTGTGNTLWTRLSGHRWLFLASRTVQANEIYKQSRQPSALSNNVHWILSSAAQQSRLGGWKESNILYSGMLIYHDKDIPFSLS
ncbi:hypothetical protein NE897_12290 [Yersinia ruckeri]|uniref:Putative lipoprotein n=1 Tax=Yersinia ruckeri TaxID=29486 RepID=A0A085UAM6_YERRU|nr:hypothetical protein [Yersinia ruckeri]AKA38324.1 hypothetical protein UGYR_07900 [Yersinia ruckeri]ARY99807.1 lipoprotein [Yersinia ruckeri]AUQ41931.1 hypothetical protein NJ56_08390 [Yersinia ruckeri]EEP97972.1 hypothetical protein yruck0001_3120 [Yersinia ruckeri ATCC 29473]EKN3346003.1 hypothetical protein [Yersinia ruckeri]